MHKQNESEREICAHSVVWSMSNAWMEESSAHTARIAAGAESQLPIVFLFLLLFFFLISTDFSSSTSLALLIKNISGLCLMDKMLILFSLFLLISRLINNFLFFYSTWIYIRISLINNFLIFLYCRKLLVTFI